MKPSILTAPELRAAIAEPDPSRRLVITPIAHDQITDGGVDIRLGNRAIGFDRGGLEGMSEMELPLGATQVVAPGELILWQALEYVQMPIGLQGLFTGRASFSRLGMVSATAVNVAPGSRGHLTLELANMGSTPIAMVAGQRVGQLVVVRSQSPDHWRTRRFVWDSQAPAAPSYVPISDPSAHIDISLSFLDQSVALVAQTPAGQSVLGLKEQVFDMLRPVVFTKAPLLPALREFEELISEPGIKEAEVQAFLETYPDFLIASEYVDAVPHVVLELESGSTLVPDFVLKPFGSDPCDLLEIKRPDAVVVTKVGRRPVLSRSAAAGIRQLRDYSDALRSENVRSRVQERYGLDIAWPRLQLVIGRLRGISPAAIREASAGDGVEVRTYDQLLERARFRLR